MKNLILILLSLFVVVGCSGDSEAEAPKPPFSEYLTCTPGAEFSDENARAMIDAWNDLPFAEGFLYSAGHAPLESSSLGGENKVYWQLFWEDKETADAEWGKDPSEEFSAWAEEYATVMTCDGENRRGYDAYFPAAEQDNWEPVTEWVTYAHYCKYNGEDGAEKLEQGVEAFNAYLANQEGDVAPFRYGVYKHNGENPEPYASYDFFWMNYYVSHDDAKESYGRFATEGSDVQAMFDDAATCEGPNPSDSYQFYPDPDES